MKKTWKLFSTLIKSSNIFHFSKNRLLNGVIIALLLVSIVPFIVGSVLLTKLVFDQLVLMDQSGLILSYLLNFMGLGIFFFGIFYVLAVFYYSKDIENLLYMPFQPWQIISAKFLTVVVYEYVLVIIFYLPISMTYGILAQVPVAYYLVMLIIGAMVPVIPLIIASVFVMLILRFTSIGKRKELMTFVAGFLVLGISLGFNLMLQSLTTKEIDMNAMIENIEKGNNSLMTIVGNLFPGMNFGAKALVYAGTSEGYLNLLVFILLIVVGVVVFNLLAQKIYFKGAIGMSDTTAKRESIHHDEWEKTSRVFSAFISFMRREIKLLMRSPVYFMNSILISVFLPGIFFFIFLFAPDSDPDFQKLMQLLSSNQVPEIKISVIIALGFVMGGMNGIAATGISREGNGVGYMKFLPVRLITQVLAKVMVGTIVGYIGVLIFSLGMIYFEISIISILIGLVLGFISCLFSALVGIFIDLIHPKLQWENEQQAMKQNMNLLFVILISAGLAFLSVFSAIKLQISLTALILLFGMGGLALCMLMYQLINRVAIPFFWHQDH